MLETAGAHEQGDCHDDCPHPDCVWVGVVALDLFDDVETAARQLEPVLL